MGRCTDLADARNRFAAALGARELEIFRRGSRWVALAADVVAFAAADDDAWSRLRLEATLLAHLHAAGIPAPRILAEDPSLGIQIRERVAFSGGGGRGGGAWRRAAAGGGREGG